MKLLRMRLLTSGVLRHAATPGTGALALALGLSGLPFLVAQEPVKPKAVDVKAVAAHGPGKYASRSPGPRQSTMTPEEEGRH